METGPWHSPNLRQYYVPSCSPKLPFAGLLHGVPLAKHQDYQVHSRKTESTSVLKSEYQSDS